MVGPRAFFYGPARNRPGSLSGRGLKARAKKARAGPRALYFVIKDLVNYYLLNLILLLFNYQMHLKFFILDEKLPFYSSFKYRIPNVKYSLCVNLLEERSNVISYYYITR